MSLRVSVVSVQVRAVYAFAAAETSVLTATAASTTRAHRAVEHPV